MDQFHQKQDILSDFIEIKCSSMLFTRDTTKTYGTSAYVHWETGTKAFLEALLLIETNRENWTQSKHTSIGKCLNTLSHIN